MGSLEASVPDNQTAAMGDAEFKPLEPEEFRKQAHRAVDFIADYYKNVESLPVLSRVEPGFLLNRLPQTAPSNPLPLDDILEDVRKELFPGMTHWASPNFFAYFPATFSAAAFVGDMLATSFNSVGFNWLASPAATELEMRVMDWMAKLLKLPASFTFSGNGGGVIQTTTSEAILCTLVTARDRALERLGPGNGNIAKLVAYGSDQTHLTYAKACKIAGILPGNIRAVETVAEEKFALSPKRLRECMEADVAAGLVPVYVCATVGTTSTTAIDPVEALARVAKEFGAWVHVDAAYAGSACICPEFRPYLDGVELANSMSMSPHKWFLSYLDCCCLWVRDRDLLVHGLNIDPEYLKNKPSESRKVIDYKDWQIGVGRRFRALRLWLVFRNYGVANLQAHIRSDVRLARRFEELVGEDPRFEIVVPRRFALVCFRLGPGSGEAELKLEGLNRALVEEVNASGRAYITHTVVGGVYVVRFAVGSTLTEERHVVAAWDLIRKTADGLVGKRGEAAGHI